MPEPIKAHSFCYENGAVTITGVKEVKSFSEREVVLLLEDGGLNIRGEEMSVSELDTATGIVKVCGKLGNIAYLPSVQPLSFLKRLLK